MVCCHCGGCSYDPLSGNGQARPFNDPRSERNDAIDQAAATESRDPACHARTLVSTGGSMPHNPHTLAVRWIGYSNFELVYNGHILLLDAYYDRGGVYPSLGFKAADVINQSISMFIFRRHIEAMVFERRNIFYPGSFADSASKRRPCL